MFTSLRFPDAKECRETELSPEFADKLGLTGRIAELSCSAFRKNILLNTLSRLTSNRRVLQYRQQLATELHSVPESFRMLSRFALFGEDLLRGHQQCFREDSYLSWKSLGFFRFFSEGFDQFFPELEEFFAQSDALKRFCMFCRDFAESIVYRELKEKAEILQEQLVADKGFALRLRADEHWSTMHCRRAERPQKGCAALAEEALALFGEREKDSSPRFRPLTEDELIFDGKILGENHKTATAAQEFDTLFSTLCLPDFLRLAEEAIYFVTAEEWYRKLEEKDMPPCCPVLADTPSQTRIEGLYFQSANSTIRKNDYTEHLLPQMTVVAGEDSLLWAQNLGTALVFTAAGGFLSARAAAVFPTEHLFFSPEQTPQLGNEESFCLWAIGDETLLPSEEAREAEKLLYRGGQEKRRGVIILIYPGNLTVLKKKAADGLLPPYTPVLLGSNQKVEELLRQWRLTPEALNKEGNRR